MTLERFWFIASGSFLIVFLALGLVVFLVPDSVPRGVFGLVTESEASGDFVAASGECALVGDNPPCGSVDLREIVSLINLWARGGATLSDVVKLINQWAEPGPITTTTSTTITSTTSTSTTTTTVPAGITVVVPNGGETWQRGTSRTVTWNYTGSPGSNVKLTLLKAGTDVGTIVSSTSIGSGGNGSFVWNISPTSPSLGSDFTVLVKSTTQPGINDTSDEYFTLTPASTTTTTTTPTTTTTISGPTVEGVQIFPEDHIWNTRVDTLPLDSNSAGYINTIGATQYLNFYFGFPYNVVDSAQAKQMFSSIGQSYYSDNVAFPIPEDPEIETLCADRHMLIIDVDSHLLYESYMTNQLPNGSWTSGLCAVWNLSDYSFRRNNITPMWSTDAAGLPVFPGLLRYDEVASGSINHALRFVIDSMRGDYIWNARASAPWGEITDPNYPPAGQRFRLKSSFNISGYPTQARVILTALKKYGMILADNGASFTISGTPDARWNNTDIYTIQNSGPLQVHASDFEAVNVSSLMIDEDSQQANLSAI
jgi:hypothetical protein